MSDKSPLCLSHNEILVEAAKIWKQPTINHDRLWAIDREYKRRFGTHITLGHIAFIEKIS